MKNIVVLAGAGLVSIGLIGAAVAQSGPMSGTPTSPFPYAAPHEVRDGCRTVYIQGTNSRVPVECAEPLTTGSVAIVPAQPMEQGMMTGSATSGTPGSTYPYAAPHEVRGGCRTVYDQTTNTRVPVDC